MTHHRALVIVIIAIICVAYTYADSDRCTVMRSCPGRTTAPTAVVDAHAEYTSVSDAFTSNALNAQIAMIIDDCVVVDGRIGAEVNTDSIIPVMSVAKSMVDMAIFWLIDNGYMQLTWALRYALRNVIPNLGKDGYGDTTIGMWLQYQGGGATLAYEQSLAAMQYGAPNNRAELKAGLRDMRPTFLPKPPGNNWYPNPNGGNRTTHQYNPLVMGWIGEFLVEANNPFGMSFTEFMESPVMRGVIEKAITRPNNGLVNRYNRYSLNFKMTPALFQRQVFPRKYFPVVRNATMAELIYAAKGADFNSVQNKMLLVSRYFLGLLEPAVFPPGAVFPDIYPDGLNITIPLMKDPTQGNIDNPAFALRTNAITLAAFGAQMASLGKVASNPRFLSQSLVVSMSQRVSNETDYTLDELRSYGRGGSTKPIWGQISSCLPEDTVVVDGMTGSFIIYSYSLKMTIVVVTADWADKKAIGAKLDPMGMAVVDAGCRARRAQIARQQ